MNTLDNDLYCITIAQDMREHGVRGELLRDALKYILGAPRTHEHKAPIKDQAPSQYPEPHQRRVFKLMDSWYNTYRTDQLKADKILLKLDAEVDMIKFEMGIHHVWF